MKETETNRKQGETKMEKKIEMIASTIADMIIEENDGDREDAIENFLEIDIHSEIQNCGLTSEEAGEIESEVMEAVSEIIFNF